MSNPKSGRAICELFEKVHRDYLHAQGVLSTFLEQVTPNELVDSGYYLDRAAKVVDDLAKELRAKLVAVNVRLLERAVAENDYECVRGEQATAVLVPVVRARVPKKGSPEHYEICSMLGVPAEHQDSVKISYDGLSNIATALTGEGKVLPESFGKTWIDPKVTYRRRNRDEQK